jgi:fermentation-respiration switch protein FrsA (DUF1100 family)
MLDLLSATDPEQEAGNVDRTMTNFITTVLIAYGVIIAALYLFQRNLLYLPDTSVPSPAAHGVPEMRPVTVRTEDGLALVGWYREAQKNHPTFVYFHGNAGNVGARGFKARSYLDAGFGMLLAGYRGYGGNPGKPSEEGFYSDGRAAVQFLADQGISPENIVVYGESLGSGVAIHMAYEQARKKPPFAAVILEAPYTSITDVAAHHYPYVPVRWLLKDHFRSVDKVATIDAPLLAIHGEKDRTIPVKFGRGLFEVAAEPKESHWLAGAAHNDLFDHGVANIAVEFLIRRLELSHPQK